MRDIQSYEHRVSRARAIIAAMLFAALLLALYLSWSWLFYDVIQFPDWSMEAKIIAVICFAAFLAACWLWDRRAIARRSSEVGD